MKFLFGLWMGFCLYAGVVGVAAQTPSAQPYSFYDGYFTSNYGPVHLIHEDADLRVSLGSDYHLRVGFQVNVGAPNPCSRREEKECKLIQQIVSRDSSGKEEFVAGWKEGLNFRVGSEPVGDKGESINFGIPSVTVPRTAVTKNNFLVVKVVKEGVEVYRKEWPLEIR